MRDQPTASHRPERPFWGSAMSVVMPIFVASGAVKDLGVAQPLVNHRCQPAEARIARGQHGPPLSGSASLAHAILLLSPRAGEHSHDGVANLRSAGSTAADS